MRHALVIAAALVSAAHHRRGTTIGIVSAISLGALLLGGCGDSEGCGDGGSGGRPDSFVRPSTSVPTPLGSRLQGADGAELRAQFLTALEQAGAAGDAQLARVQRVRSYL